MLVIHPVFATVPCSLWNVASREAHLRELARHVGADEPLATKLGTVAEIARLFRSRFDAKAVSVAVHYIAIPVVGLAGRLRGCLSLFLAFVFARLSRLPFSQPRLIVAVHINLHERAIEIE